MTAFSAREAFELTHLSEVFRLTDHRQNDSYSLCVFDSRFSSRCSEEWRWSSLEWRRCQCQPCWSLRWRLRLDSFDESQVEYCPFFVYCTKRRLRLSWRQTGRIWSLRSSTSPSITCRHAHLAGGEWWQLWWRSLLLSPDDDSRRQRRFWTAFSAVCTFSLISHNALTWRDVRRDFGRLIWDTQHRCCVKTGAQFNELLRFVNWLDWDRTLKMFVVRNDRCTACAHLSYIVLHTALG